jgi:hypothetical protein
MVLRRVLHAYREGWLLEERLAGAARMAAEDARARGLTAGEMLVALKREWGLLGIVPQLPRHDARELLDRLVSLSIRAYYRVDDEDARAREGWERASSAPVERASTAA